MPSAVSGGRKGLTKMVAAIAVVVGLAACKNNRPVAETEVQSAPAANASAYGLVETYSPEVKRLNEVFLSMKSSRGAEYNDKISGAIAEIQKIAAANKNSAVAQFYHAMTNPLKKLDGIVWRLGDLARESDPAYIAVVKGLRGVAYREYLYGDHILEFLLYLARPSKELTVFKTLSDVQAFILTELDPAVKQSIETLKRLASDPSMRKQLQFAVDMRLFAGLNYRGQPMRVLSEKNATRTFLPYHLDYYIAQLEKLRAMGHLATAYDVDQAPYLANKLIKKSFKKGLKQVVTLIGRTYFGRDKGGDSALNILTPADLAEELRDPEWASFLTLHVSNGGQGKALSPGAHSNANTRGSLYRVSARGDRIWFNGKGLMAEARSLFVSGLKHERSAVLALIEHGQSLDGDSNRYTKAKKFVANPLLPLFNLKEVREKMDSRLAMLQGDQKTIRHSVGTGKPVAVRPGSFFSGHKDLKVFFPNTFVRHGDSDFIDFPGSGGKKMLSYLKGRPMGWPDPTFGGLLPDANPNNVYDVLRNLSLDYSATAVGSVIPAPRILVTY